MKWSGPGGEYDLLLWWGSVVYITSSRSTVRLGSLQGLYRVSRLKSKSGSSSHTGGTVQGRAALLYSMFKNQVYRDSELGRSCIGIGGPDRLILGRGIGKWGTRQGNFRDQTWGIS